MVAQVFLKKSKALAAFGIVERSRIFAVKLLDDLFIRSSSAPFHIRKPGRIA
jgi:hypothetical protein